MIPILFDGTTTDFTTNGKGRLTDSIECEVNETVNGEYELTMTYPVDGIHFDEIQMGDYIYAKPNPKENPQAFSIYLITRPINMQVEIHAEHVSYRLRYIPVEPFRATSASDAMNKLSLNAVESCPFTFSTDITSTVGFVLEAPQAIKSVLGGEDNSMLAIYGGEYHFDNFTVSLLNHRGSTLSRVLRYGVDITDLNQEERIDNTITGVCPYYYSDGSLVMLTEKVLHSAFAANYPYQRTIPLDCTSAFDSRPTESQLRTYATAYIAENNIGIPEVSINVSFVDLAKLPEYSGLVPIEEIGIGDTISVEFGKLGVSASAEIVSYKFDVLRERYTEITIGTPRLKLAETLQNIAKTDTGMIVEEAVAEAKKYQKSGSKTVTLTDATEATLLTMSELDNLFNLPSGTCTNLNTVVVASNADASITTGVKGVGYSSGAWIVKFESLVTGSVLVAYAATYYGG